MIKFIEYWMFATHIWHDTEPTPVAINLHEILRIEEMFDKTLGKYVAIYLKDHSVIPIEGDIINVLAEFQKHLQTIY